MKPLLSLLALVVVAALAATFSARAGRAADGARPGPQALVDVERAFAHAADTSNVRDAFVAYLAPTAIVFQDGPIAARPFYLAKKPGKTKLAWQPAFAVMSGAGDLGWTTGPWQWRQDGSKKAPQATGDYTTLWRRQRDGTLRAVLDVGVSHDPPPAGTPAPEPLLRTLTGTRTGTPPLSDRHSLWQADADYARAVAANGRAAAFAAAATDDVRLQREGHFPVIGRDAGRDTLAAHPAEEKLVSLAQFVANSGDLGYTYGSLVARTTTGVDSCDVVHIWHREPGHPWKLACELVKPTKE